MVEVYGVSLVCLRMFGHRVVSREMLNRSLFSALYISAGASVQPLFCGEHMKGELASLPCDCGVRLQK